MAGEACNTCGFQSWCLDVTADLEEQMWEHHHIDGNDDYKMWLQAIRDGTLEIEEDKNDRGTVWFHLHLDVCDGT